MTHIAIAAGAVIGGAIIGWVLRARRCLQEKAAVNEGWQGQIEAQRAEHERLVTQNKGLMQQVSQFQASQRDATNRAKELSDALKETFQRRDELQREIKTIRNNLQSAVAERDKLQSDIRERAADTDSAAASIRQKDDKIFRLSRELENWQNRLPPLIERFRERDREANELEDALEAARERIVDLENLLGSEETRVEPVDREALGEDIDASNDPNNVTQTGLPDVLADDGATDIAEAVSQHPPDQEAAPDDEAVGDSVDETAALPDPDTGSAAAPSEDTISPTELIPEALLLAGNAGFAHVDEEQDEGPVEDDPWRDAAADFAGDETDADPAIGDDDEDETDHEFDVDIEIEIDDEQFDAMPDVGESATDDAEGDEDAEDDDAIAARDDTDEDDDAEGLNHQEPRGGLRDNLKLIKGVGPAIEKTLNELGISRFTQIAEMSEYDIDRVARRLRGFRSRIYREDWIGQARDLQEQKSASHH